MLSGTGFQKEIFDMSDRDRLLTWGKVSQEKIRQYSYSQSTDGLKQALERLTDKPPKHLHEEMSKQL